MEPNILFSSMISVREPFYIRPATVADIGVIARQRASMFLDMGSIMPHVIGDLMEMTRACLEEAVPRGDYIGWLGSPDGEPVRIVAGAGVQIRRVRG